MRTSSIHARKESKQDLTHRSAASQTEKEMLTRTSTRAPIVDPTESEELGLVERDQLGHVHTTPADSEARASSGLSDMSPRDRRAMALLVALCT